MNTNFSIECHLSRLSLFIEAGKHNTKIDQMSKVSRVEMQLNKSIVRVAELGKEWRCGRLGTTDIPKEKEIRQGNTGGSGHV